MVTEVGGISVNEHRESVCLRQRLKIRLLMGRSNQCCSHSMSCYFGLVRVFPLKGAISKRTQFYRKKI